eukprot:TRINITY_DN897_c0_g2_i1.p1 TRINITY_DN897_c0_g2~~TRINITY_DN897_c0_g2_i1.p1  ORF type:complete len:147 (+),score=19.64 TRINITY_DN897_c0_g2_i1:43-483(+)
MLIINIGATAGEHDHFEVGDTTYCVAQQWVMLMWLLPIAPTGPPRLMINYQSCDRRYRYLDFKEMPKHAWLKTILYAYLRVLTLGILCAFKMNATEERKEELLRCAGVGSAVASPAVPVYPVVAARVPHDIENPEEADTYEKTLLQ